MYNIFVQVLQCGRVNIRSICEQALGDSDPVSDGQIRVAAQRPSRPAPKPSENSLVDARSNTTAGYKAFKVAHKRDKVQFGDVPISTFNFGS